ncbi:MAG: hypothetical protein A2W25_05260 [candidate division Zixibacteria bacterium RBG_16_53_22]|nr:MAG: hypothetical protein A2W25_05260 [candidate division Zixibacteria bacterium RBG_16_53_22]
METVKGFTNIGYNFIMDFHDWLNKKFLKWRGDSIGLEGSKANFARWLGISPQSLDEYLNKNGQIPKHKKTIDKLVNRFGPEVYQVLGIEPPDILSFSHLPPEMRARLEAALSETKSELSLHGISEFDPEAEDVVIRIFSKHGFKYTRTTKS